MVNTRSNRSRVVAFVQATPVVEPTIQDREMGKKRGRGRVTPTRGGARAIINPV